jgi:hypothetical protein
MFGKFIHVSVCHRNTWDRLLRNNIEGYLMLFGINIQILVFQQIKKTLPFHGKRETYIIWNLQGPLENKFVVDKIIFQWND